MAVPCLQAIKLCALHKYWLRGCAFFYGYSVPASSNVVCFTRVYGCSVPESNASCEIQNLTRLRIESLPDVLMHRCYWFILN